MSIRVEEFFWIRDIRRNVLSKFIGSCTGAHLDGQQYGGRKPTETSVTEFCYKGVNFSHEELINIKVILFLIH